jgi:tetratricopeptide (TPR) repeat protein
MDDLKTQIEQLESVLSKNERSPLFTRLASLYITQRDYSRAIRICESGTSVYPSYATGFLLKARALQQSGRLTDALEDYKRVLEILPRCTIARNEVDAILAKEKTKEKREEVNESGKQVIGEEPVISPAEHDEHGTPRDRYIENLAERLKEYKPARLKDTEPLPAASEGEIAEPDEFPIVSETLAEIFLQQRQYLRARDAYRQLQKKTPHKSGVYQEKIAEIEERIRTESLR